MQAQPKRKNENQKKDSDRYGQAFQVLIASKARQCRISQND
jgi:hypothetical protein